MSFRVNSFSHEVKAFVNENKVLCALTLGLAIVGFCIGKLAGRGVVQLQHVFGSAHKTDEVGKKKFTNGSIEGVNNQIEPTETARENRNIVAASQNVFFHTVVLNSERNASPSELEIRSDSSNILQGVNNSSTTEEISNLVNPQEDLEKEKIATSIKTENIYREYAAQLAYKKETKHHLRDSLFERAKLYIDEPEKIKDLPIASRGRTRVYFHDELPIVLKESGSPENKKRFEKMKQGREICDAHNYSHLAIPTARIHGDFIIESRLPIMKDLDTKMQIGFYLNHVEEFTEAVEEFIGFRCCVRLDDITGGTTDAYSTLSKVPIGRYDNVAMYLEDGRGKLGLIDLESFYPIAKEDQQQHAFFACLDAVRLFPHHLDTIMHEAKKFNPNIEERRKELESERDLVLEYFKKAYQDHLDFVKQKGVDLSDPVKFPDISPTRKEKLIEAIEILIGNENNDVLSVRLKDYLGENPKEALSLFKKAFPEILDATLKFISDLLESNIEDRGGTPISNDSELLSARTLEFNDESDIYINLKKTIASNLNMLTFKNNRQKTRFISKIIDGVLKELEKGREIAYYNPSFGVGGHAAHCIFC